MAFTPADIALHWWRGEDIPSGTPDPLNWDDNIDSWRLQATGSAIPTYDATAINSLPGLDFDGGGDNLVSTTAKLITGTIGVACVANANTNASEAWVGLTTSASIPSFGSTTRLYPSPYAGATDTYYYNGTGVKTFRHKPVLPTSTDLVLSTVAGPLALGYWSNGATDVFTGGNGTVSPVAFADSMYAHVANMRNDYRWNGPICEIVIWNETKLCERVYIEGFLADKYGITLNTSHPFFAAPPTSAPGSGSAAVNPLSGGLIL
jgi:hypothetical protein